MSMDAQKKEQNQDPDQLDLILLIAHEIRAPLGIVKESISLVVDKVLGKTNDKQQHVLMTARRNVDRIDRVIMNLVDISKLDAGRMELQKEKFDLVTLVRQTLDPFQAVAAAQGVELKAVFPREEVDCYADRQRLASVLKHLIGNGLKFTEKGRVEVRVNETAEGFECVVEDTGIGISSEDKPKLFSKFQQMGWVPGGGEKGMGLGLAICRGIIRLHGGDIRVQSEVHKGSVFSFTLPRGN